MSILFTDLFTFLASPIACTAIIHRPTIIELLLSLILVSVVFLIIRYYNYSKFVKKTMSSEFEKGAEQERKRIAHELHDDIASTINMAKMLLTAQKSDIPINSDISRNINSLLNNADSNLRALSHKLCDFKLLEKGLVYEVDQILQQMSLIDPSLSCIHEHNYYYKIDKSSEIAVYRAIQEFTCNTLKHSGATRIHLTIQSVGKDLRCVYQDNGKGTNLSENQNGLGIISIRQRIEALGGQIHIFSETNRGFRAEIMIS